MARGKIEWWCVVGLVLFLGEGTAEAFCPFCDTQSQTFTQEMESMDAVVFARLAAPPPPSSDDPNAPIPKGKFELVEVLKGKEWATPKSVIEVLYYGDAEVGTNFMVLGVVEGKGDKLQSVVWSTPLKITSRSRDYLKKLPTLPKSGAERLQFFQSHLEDSEELLARDAYGEFAGAPYSDVIALKPHMDHGQLLAWIKNDDIPASRRRLYLTMLGVCGGPQDVPVLEEMIRGGDRARKAGLDALLAAFLTLKGESGVPLLEELYLKNDKAEYADVNAAIMALRFHGTETEVIPRSAIVKSTRLLLERPNLADLIIPDLARWEDWESLDRLVRLFKEADATSTWVREPIVNFVKACPLPEAKERLKELESIDPAAVKRANRLFPFGPPKPPADAKQTSAVGEVETDTSVVPAVALSSAGSTRSEVASDSAQPVSAAVRLGTASVNGGAPPAAAARRKPLEEPNRWTMLCVTAGVGLLIGAAQWTALRGQGTTR